jgi:YidC/Oxa1 family membrane protein insertase
MLVTANIFQPLIDVFEAVIKVFHNSAGIPWGWSIVLLTVVVRAAMIPLTLKQIKSMVRMQQLAPEMKAIQAKYKEDKQRQQQEIMKFYKENNVNPLGSCLPLVAQLPVFVSLYYMLRQSLRADICPAQQHRLANGKIDLAHTVVCGTGPHSHAGFLFISDLTNKATGATLVVLLILYVGTQLMSSLVMSAATTDPMQRRIMMFMPLIFVLVVIRFPAGVLVYWITTNTWTIGQQYIVKRRIGPLRAATAAAGAGAGGGGTGSGSSSAVASSSGASSGSGFAGLMARARSASGNAAAPAETPRSTAKSAGTKTNGSRANGVKAGGTKANGSKASSGKAGTAGNGSGSGLGGLIRGKAKADEPTPLTNGGRGGPPPKSPRKKKKRSGRRR